MNSGKEKGKFVSPDKYNWSFAQMVCLYKSRFNVTEGLNDFSSYCIHSKVYTLL